MSKSNKSQLVYLLRILESCGKIKLYVNKANSSQSFFDIEEQAYFNATLTLLVQIAEQANKLDPEIRAAMPSIPWQKIKGFRNIAVHEYEYVNAEMVFEIATIEMPFLKNEIAIFIRSSISHSTLSLFELQLSAGSDFYKHVDFKTLMQ